jgi:hypothetical protein
MTSSDRHSGTATGSVRLAFLLPAAGALLAALLAAAAPALAQGPTGVIHFRTPDFTHYLVNGDGSNAPAVFPAPASTTYSTTWDNYSGHLYLHFRDDGTIPGDVDPYGNIMVWSDAAGQSKAVTEIHGPLYVISGNNARWSNDGLDSFVSFNLHDPATGLNAIYRAHVTAADIASADYLPITLDDLAPGGRLELVAAWQEGLSVFYWWHPTNHKFYYIDPRVSRRTGNKIRVKFVGVGTSMDDDPIVYSSNSSLVQMRVSPVNEQLVANAIGSGILSVNLVTLASGWIAAESKTLGQLNSPCFSPDGSLVTFGAYRSIKGKVYSGIYKVAFTGGTITPATETPLPGDPKVPLNWNW